MHQYVIVYDLGGETHVYDTAYRPSQVGEALHACRNCHGSTARSARADLLPPVTEEA